MLIHDIDSSPIEADTPENILHFDPTISLKNYTYPNGQHYPHEKPSSSSSSSSSDDATIFQETDLMHHLQLLLLDGALYRAPLKEPKKVLDCGTGNGLWALDFGHTHPGSEVVGVDWAPIQTGWHWPNVRFELENLEEELSFAENEFDYIHSRLLGMSIQSWPNYISRLFHHLKPGGYIELAEQNYNSIGCDDDHLPEESRADLLMYWKHVQNALTKLNTSMPEFTPQWFEELLKEAGFVDVEVWQYKVPWSGWAKDRRLKEVGSVVCEVAKREGDVYGNLMMTRVLNMGKSEAEEVCRRREEINASGMHHVYHYHWQIVARKPEAS